MRMGFPFSVKNLNVYLEDGYRRRVRSRTC